MTNRDCLRHQGVRDCGKSSAEARLVFKEMVELDLQYIRNRSILFDLKIILKTVLVLFGSKDAFYILIEMREMSDEQRCENLCRRLPWFSWFIDLDMIKGILLLN
jgi:Bacterial sugar transferase